MQFVDKDSFLYMEERELYVNMSVENTEAICYFSTNNTS